MTMGRFCAGLCCVMAACSYAPGRSAATGDGPLDDAAIDTPIAPPDTAIGPWWNIEWTRRRPITLDTTKLTGTSAGFPVLVRLDARSIDYDQVGANGGDLRFITLDHTTELPFEIDRFTDRDETEVWVRLPSIAMGVATSFWVYHGNPAAAGTGSGATTFAGNVSVHHLGALTDATGNGHDGTASTGGSGLTEVDGIVGRARDFDGNDDFVLLANEAAYDFTTALTVSAWVRRQALDVEYQAIVTKGDSAWRVQREDQTNNLGFGWSDTAGQFQNLVGSDNINNSNWHHVAITFDGTTKRVYVDGALDEQVANNAAILTNNRQVSIGRNEESTVGGARNWNGDIDEVRITSEVRDAAWLRAEHITVTDNDFVTIGAEEQLP